MTARKPSFAIASLVLALCGSTASRAARAEDASIARARDYFRAGAQAYSIGEYAAAIQAFEQAYALAPRPAVLFSIAQAERRQFFLTRDPIDLERSIAMYRRYIHEESQPARKTDAVQALSELEPLLASLAKEAPSPMPGPEAPAASKVANVPEARTRLMISTPAAGASITLDDQRAGTSPLVREVTAGEHTVKIQAPGYKPSERRVIAVAGELVTVDLPLVEQPALLEVIAPNDAQLSIDGRVQGRCPFPRPIELAAGVHLITVSKNGFVGVSSEETLQRGQTKVFRAQLRVSSQRTIAKFMLGASASALTAGGVFAYFSHRQDQAGEDFLKGRGERRYTPEDLDSYNKTRADRDRIRGAAWLSFGVGLGLGVTSALMLIYDGGSVETIKNPERASNQTKRNAPKHFPQPIIGPGFAGLGLQGRF